MKKIFLLVVVLVSSGGCALSNALYWADPEASHATVNAKVLTSLGPLPTS